MKNIGKISISLISVIILYILIQAIYFLRTTDSTVSIQKTTIIQTTGLQYSGISISGNVVGTGSEIVEITPIDEVYSALEQGINGKDYIAIKFPKQNIQYSAGVKASLNTYLKDNIKGFTLPKDVKGYLYIRLAKNLIYMESAKTLQPINIYTNAFDVNNQRVYGRLDLTKSLDVYNEKSEFLYDLSNIPLKNVANADWLQSKAGKDISIGGVISDTNGNYIESMVFVFTLPHQ